MKLFVLTFLFASSLFAAGPVPEKKAPDLRYRHIQDQEGKILATIDIKSGDIDYKEDPKKVVPVLIGIVDQLSAAINKLQTPPPAKPAKK